ncbi:MAG: hypothetical protein FWD57_07115 [Polyangiaceae bacterium]|nr:hypothetical protein [Polyangiaceae bacterium]
MSIHAIVNGFDNYVSYGYAAGTQLSEINIKGVSAGSLLLLLVAVIGLDQMLSHKLCTNAVMTSGIIDASPSSSRVCHDDTPIGISVRRVRRASSCYCGDC